MISKTLLVSCLVVLLTLAEAGSLRDKRQINVCLSNPCQNSGRCTVFMSSAANNLSQVYCICYNGYSGTYCETKVTNACTNNPCGSGGSCYTRNTNTTTYTCYCSNGTYGTSC